MTIQTTGTALTLTLILNCCTACSQTNQYELKDEDESFTDLEAFFQSQSGDGMPNFGTLRLHSNRDDLSEVERTYYLEALVYNPEKTNGVRTAIDGGMATLSNFELYSNAGDQHVPNRYFAGMSSVNATKLPVFGQTTSWGLAGNPAMDIPPASVEMYVPHEISIITPQFGPPTQAPPVSRTDDLTVTWNADPQNTWGVIIHVTNLDLFFINNPQVPAEEREFATLTPDDGEYTIAAEDIAHLPTGAEIELTLMRGNYMEPLFDGKELFMYAVTIDQGTLMLTE